MVIALCGISLWRAATPGGGGVGSLRLPEIIWRLHTSFTYVEAGVLEVGVGMLGVALAWRRRATKMIAPFLPAVSIRQSEGAFHIKRTKENRVGVAMPLRRRPGGISGGKLERQKQKIWQ